VLVMLFAIVAVERAFVFARRRFTRDAIVMALAVAAAAASHPTGGLLAAGFATFFGMRAFARFDRRAMVWSAVVFLALAGSLPWLIQFAFPDFLKQKNDPSLQHFVQTSAYFFRPMVLMVVAVGVWLAAENLGRDRALLLGSTAIVPFALLLLWSFMLVKVTARYAIVTLPVTLWLVGHVAVRLGAVPGIGRRAARAAMLALLPALVASDFCLHLVDYYGAQRGQRPRWVEAVARLREVARQKPLLVWTINPPTLLYYLRPEQYRTMTPSAPSEHEVWPLNRWMIGEGKDERQNVVCEPGAAAHVAYLRHRAQQRGAQLAVAVSRPELVEEDPKGEVRALLQREFELIEHYPCWIGPKDDSIYVYLPKEP
jgi:hypothetical protein